MLGREPAARHHEGRIAIGQRDAHARRDEGALPRFQAHGLGRHQVCSGIARVGVARHDGVPVQHRGDNGDINGFSHLTRLMQNTAPETRSRYRERLSPSLWLLVTVALAGPMVALIFVPVGSTIALVAGAAVSAALVAAFIAAAPLVSVDGSMLHAGRAHIDVRHLGDPVALTGDEARQARGPALPARGWHLIRGGIDGLVVVPNTDQDDPVDTWTISTRTPDRLAAAIRAAKD